ncbi:MAG: hypothetical protein R2882_12235 [Gemmatimonadales bacterium]
MVPPKRHTEDRGHGGNAELHQRLDAAAPAGFAVPKRVLREAEAADGRKELHSEVEIGPAAAVALAERFPDPFGPARRKPAAQDVAEEVGAEGAEILGLVAPAGLVAIENADPALIEQDLLGVEVAVHRSVRFGQFFEGADQGGGMGPPGAAVGRSQMDQRISILEQPLGAVDRSRRDRRTLLVQLGQRLPDEGGRRLRPVGGRLGVGEGRPGSQRWTITPWRRACACTSSASRRVRAPRNAVAPRCADANRFGAWSFTQYDAEAVAKPADEPAFGL